MAKFNNETYFEVEEYEVPYTQIENEILDNKKMSFKAQGVLVQILRFRNSKQHKIYQASLVTMKKDGKTAVASAIKELIELGYLTKHQIRNEKGHIKGVRYIVHIKPKPQNQTSVKNDNLPKTDNPTSDNPTSENQSHKRKYSYNANTVASGTNGIGEVDINLPFDMVKEEEEKLNYKVYNESEIENFNQKAKAYYSFYLTKSQIDSSIRKIYKKYLDGQAKDYPKLLDADLHKKEDRAREKKELEYKKDETVQTTPYTGRVPFYNWLEN